MAIATRQLNTSNALNPANPAQRRTIGPPSATDYATNTQWSARGQPGGPASAPLPATQPPPVVDAQSVVANAGSAASMPVAAPALPASTAPDYSALISQIMASAAQAPAPPAAAQIVAERPDAVTYQVDPSQTAGGLVQKMLQEDSPYLQVARKQAMEGMNERGLLSSSIAQAAGVGAAYDRAGALATTDAGIYANRMNANQDAVNNMANNNANRGMTASTFNAGAQNDFGMAGYQASIKNSQMAFQSALNVVESAVANDLAKDRDGNTAKLDMAKQQFGADLNLKTLATVFGYDLTKLDAASKLTLTEMLVKAGIDTTEADANRTFVAGENAANRTFTASENSANRASAIETSRLNAETQLTTAGISRSTTLEVAGINRQFSQAASLSSAASSLLIDFNRQAASLAQADLTPEAKDAGFAALLQNMKGSLAIQGVVLGNTDVGAVVDQAFGAS